MRPCCVCDGTGAQELPGGALPSSHIDRKLWVGAAAEGWSMRAGADQHYVYMSPDGRRFTSRQKARAAGATQGGGAPPERVFQAAKAAPPAPRPSKPAGTGTAFIPGPGVPPKRPKPASDAPRAEVNTCIW